eukprot:3148331-Karenia_brevis.AAC.1
MGPPSLLESSREGGPIFVRAMNPPPGLNPFKSHFDSQSHKLTDRQTHPDRPASQSGQPRQPDRQTDGDCPPRQPDTP